MNVPNTLQQIEIPIARAANETAESIAETIARYIKHNYGKEMFQEAQQDQFTPTGKITVLVQLFPIPPDQERAALPDLEATMLYDSRYVVLPEGALGTMGALDGHMWRAFFCDAESVEDALRQAKGKVWCA